MSRDRWISAAQELKRAVITGGVLFTLTYIAVALLRMNYPLRP